VSGCENRNENEESTSKAESAEDGNKQKEQTRQERKGRGEALRNIRGHNASFFNWSPNN